MCCGEEPHDRQHEVGGVQVLRAEVLREGAGSLVPPVAYDCREDLLFDACPLGDLVLRTDAVRDRDGAVEGDPAHDLRVQEVPRVTSDLPDALIGLLPANGGRVGAGDEEGPGVLVELADLLVQAMGGVEQFAVDVDLLLAPCAVAHADGTAVLPAGQMREGTLGQIMLPTHTEHDLQGGPVAQRAGGGGREEGEEVAGLVRAGRHPQRVHREAGVADPGEAVVPVALAAGTLGERRRRGRDDRATRLVGQRLQHPAAVMDLVGPGPLVVLVQLAPGTPTGDGGLQPGAEVVLGPDVGRHLLQGAAVQAEHGGLAGMHAEVSRGRRAGHRQGHGRGQDEPFRPATCGNPAVHLREQGVDEPVFRAWPVLHLDVHAAGRAAHLPYQQARRALAQLVTGVVRADGQCVGEGRRAGRGLEGGLQHHRAVQVATHCAVLGGRGDRPVAGRIVEESAEYGRAVESGKAQPLDGPCPADESRRVAVGQQRVLGDREVTHQRLLIGSLVGVGGDQ